MAQAKKKPKAARGVGRPPKELTDLPKAWKSLILNTMKKGASKEEVKGLLLISNDLYTRFMKEETEFSETILLGEMLSRKWWDETGRKSLRSRVFRDRLYALCMQNRFGTGQVTVNINKKQDLSKLDANDLEALAALVAKSSDPEGD